MTNQIWSGLLLLARAFVVKPPSNPRHGLSRAELDSRRPIPIADIDVQPRSKIVSTKEFETLLLERLRKPYLPRDKKTPPEWEIEGNVWCLHRDCWCEVQVFARFEKVFDFEIDEDAEFMHLTTKVDEIVMELTGLVVRHPKHCRKMLSDGRHYYKVYIPLDKRTRDHFQYFEPKSKNSPGMPEDELVDS